MLGLMLTIYTLGIRLYSFAAQVLAMAGHKKAKLWIKGRRNTFKDIEGLEGDIVWFHASSMGEFEDGRTVLESIKKKYPHYKILLTFFSSSGYEGRKNYPFANRVAYMPLDTASNASLFLDILKPQVVFFMRTDIWPNFLFELKNRSIPVFHIALQLNTGTAFTKWPQKALYKHVFACFNQLFVQNEKTLEQLNALGVYNAHITRSPRADRITAAAATDLSLIHKFVNDYFTVVVGSTLEPDDKLLLETINLLKEYPIKFIIAPHEIHSEEISAYSTLIGERSIIYSEYASANGTEQVLWIDNIGMLSRIYKYAAMAYVGGGFSKIGIHNTLEPAVYGCPVAFGPRHRYYAEAVDMMQMGTAKVVKNATELKEMILGYYTNEELLQKHRQLNREYVQQMLGATSRIMEYLEKNRIL